MLNSIASIPIAVIICSLVVTYFAFLRKTPILSAYFRRRVSLVIFLLVNAVVFYILHIALKILNITGYELIFVLAFAAWTTGICVILSSYPQRHPFRIFVIGFLICTFVIVTTAEFKGLPISEILISIDNATIGEKYAERENSIRPSRVLVGMFYFFNCFYLFMFLVHGRRDLSDFLAKTDSAHAFKVEAINNIFAVCAAAVALILSLALSGVDLKIVGIMTAIFSAGAAAVLKDLLMNVAAGAVLLINKDIKENDVLDIDGFGIGVVDKMGLRYTVFKNRDDMRVLVPNSQIFKNPINHLTLEGERRTRLHAEVGVSYKSDIPRAKSLMASVGYNIERVLSTPEPTVQTRSFNDSDITLRLCFWIGDPEKGIGNVRSQVFDYILATFDENEIEIPFPRIDLSYSGNPPILNGIQK